MKKLLTTATLLGIGTAASLATDFTLYGTACGSDYVSGARAAITSITLDDGTVLSGGDLLDGSLYSWSISFQVTAFNPASGGVSLASQETLFSVDRSGGVGQGYGVLAYEDGDDIYYSLTSTAQNHNNSPTILGTSEASTLNQTITISWDANDYALSLDVAGMRVVSEVLESAVSLITAATATDNSGHATSFWTNSAATPISNITLSVSAAAVPEPSMFGALAGLVALGFVAKRRRPRNNRKA